MSNSQSNLTLLTAMKDVIIIVWIIYLLVLYYIDIEKKKEIQSSIYNIKTTQEKILNSYNREFIIECNLE